MEPTAQEKSKKKEAFAKRKTSLKKKASELSTLCDVPVLLLFTGYKNELEVWPEDRCRALDVVSLYRAAAVRPRTVDAASFSPQKFLERELRGLSLSHVEKELDGMIQKIEKRMARISAAWISSPPIECGGWPEVMHQITAARGGV